MLGLNNIYLGDCLELMKDIPNQFIDMILCDLPYEVTARQKWDIIIPFDKLWNQYERIVKDNGIIILFATEPFRTKLISSNIDLFKYDLIWSKNKSTGFLNAKRQPLRSHESILIFYKNPSVYNPQKVKGESRNASFKRKRETNTLIYGDVKENSYTYTEERYPTSLLEFKVLNNDSPDRFHSAQKPIELLEWLIKSYSNEGNIVLDNCFGSGSTLLAAKNLKRNFLGIEKEEKYFNIAKQRLNENQKIQT